MELHGYVGIQRVWAWAQVVPMDNLVDGQRVGRWVMGWIWTSSTRPKPDPLPSLILTKTLSPIKGHNSKEEEVVGIMKNLLFNIIHAIPINYHDFFIRTLANVALSPFELKPYAP